MNSDSKKESKKVKINEMVQLAEDWVSDLLPQENSATVIGLQGNLGAGKTTFTQHVAHALKIDKQVNSPTFVIQKIYKLDSQKFDKLIHIDAYRLESPQELESLDWKEISSDPKNLILIEWPEQVMEILSPQTKFISFEVVDEETRKIEIS